MNVGRVGGRRQSSMLNIHDDIGEISAIIRRWSHCMHGQLHRQAFGASSPSNIMIVASSTHARTHARRDSFVNMNIV